MQYIAAAAISVIALLFVGLAIALGGSVFVNRQPAEGEWLVLAGAVVFGLLGSVIGYAAHLLWFTECPV